MSSNIHDLTRQWRELGPVAWSENAYGWIVPEGQPIKLTPWQRAALLAWWAYRETVSTLALSVNKKTGKTLTNAVLTCWRWLCLPGEHFCCGNDLDQSAGRQFQEIADMVGRHPVLRHHVKVTARQLVFTPTGSTLTALAVDATGNAGSNHLTASHTEAWGIIQEGSVRAYEELTPPPGRFYGLPPLRICDSYGGYVGESETWHNLVDRGLAGERVSDDWPVYLSGGLLLFHMEGTEAQERCFRGTPEEARAYYAEQAASLRPLTFQRLHENRRTTNESAFITAEQWEACRSPEVRPLVEGDKRKMVLGADASTTRDLTALVGTVWNEQTKVAEVVYSKSWAPKKGLLRGGKATVDLDATIGAEIERLHNAGHVLSVRYDPYQLHSLAIALEKKGVKMVELPQTTARVAADQALYDAIISHTVMHYGDPTLTEHVEAAVAIETPRGFRLAKEKASKKIDLAVALSMSLHGCLEDSGHDGRIESLGCSIYDWPLMRTPEPGQAFDDNGRYLRPHKPGITWENCKQRHWDGGCQACDEELADYRERNRREEEARYAACLPEWAKADE